jgi:hypothetical protein
MEITLQRYSNTHESTTGLLLIDCEFQCYTLEDEFRTDKVQGKTRIPAGRYQITLRDEGAFNDRYMARFGIGFHHGMLWLRDVPNFEYILIHIGNDDDDTSGCILVGNRINNNMISDGFLGDSTSAYAQIYPIISEALLMGDQVWINVLDEGQMRTE